uniref:E3 ubiquitin-protein ligase n=1 Tax=Rhabditophanes sp. KR3021 TaxID=114890 RepID=A0AC35TMN1_9BILA
MHDLELSQDKGRIRKDCETDRTCVMCKLCFENSVHKNHNHKVTVSQGGGYCDCGDPEAWKNDYACDIHETCGTDSSESIGETILPPPIETRIREVTSSILQYSISVLAWCANDKLPCFLFPPAGSKNNSNFQAVLLNDETHTYESVIRALMGSIGCTEPKAAKIATIVDKEGRASVKFGNKSECEKVKASIQRKTSKETNSRTQRTGPLAVEIMNCNLVAHQDFACFLLKWITNQMEIFPPLALIVAGIVESRKFNAIGALFQPTFPSTPKSATYVDDDGIEHVGFDAFADSGKNFSDSSDVGLDQLRVDSGSNLSDVPVAGINLFITKTRMREQRAAEEAAKRKKTRISLEEDTLLIAMMKHNRDWWKTARKLTQNLIIAASFRSAEYKVSFAKIYMQHYEELVNAYVNDDHDHVMSITSLSVQLFTVASVAKALAQEDDVLATIFGTLVRYMAKYVKKARHNSVIDVYDFQEHPMGSYPTVMKRLFQVIMIDLQYLLQVVPTQEEWTKEMRTSFLSGMDLFIKYIQYCQDMDQVKKQIGEHQVYEMEWETAFNMQLQVQSILPNLMAWLKSDEEVHREFFRKMCNALKTQIYKHPEFKAEKECVTINGTSASCIKFDISADPLSIHQGLWRTFASLFATHLDTFLEEVKASSDEKRLAWDTTKYYEPHPNVQTDCTYPLYVYIEAPALIEFSLRCQVLIAHVNAGLWRKNGFGVVNQCHNYSAANCRYEMFDKDILMLQVGAATSNPDQFLVRVLHKYGLHNWAEADFTWEIYKKKLAEAAIKEKAAAICGESAPRFTVGPVLDELMDDESPTPHQTPLHLEETSKPLTSIAESMFDLVIHLVCERYVEGVGKVTLEDILERELIHKLALGPKPFSKLEIMLSYMSVEYEEQTFLKCLDNVSVFTQPKASQPGQFTLKAERKAEWGPFFSHYVKSESAKALEQQKEKNDTYFCKPPKMPEFCNFYKTVPNLLKCPTFVKLQKIILERVMKKSRYASAGLLHRALYTIALGLNEQLNEKNPKQFDYVEQAEKENIYETLRIFSNTSESAYHKQLLEYVMDLYKTVHNKYQGVKMAEEIKKDPAIEEMSTAEKAAIRAEKIRKVRLMAEEKMKKKAVNFEASITSTTDSPTTSKGDETTRKKLISVVDDDEDVGTLKNDQSFPVCIGHKKSELLPMAPAVARCILCQSEEELKFGKNGFISCSLSFKSMLFNQKKGPNNLNNEFDVMVDASLPEALTIRTCGHTMHYECYKNFHDSAATKERQRRINGFNSKIIDMDGGEYLCPLCKRIANGALPILPGMEFSGMTKLSSANKENQEESFSSWLVKYRTGIERPIVPYNVDEDGKPKKGHSRKRSHSERSLLDLAKHDDTEGILNSTGTTTKCVSEISLAVNNLSGERNDFLPSANSQDTSLFSVVSSKMTNPFSRIFQNEKKAMVIPEVLKDDKMIADFTKRLNEARVKKENIPKFLQACNIWQTTVFVLRSVAGVLEVENKPLFGALNIRQKETIKCMSRLSVASTCFLSTVELRSLASLLLQPLLYPLQSETKSKTSFANMIPILNNITRGSSVSSDDDRIREVRSPEHTSRLKQGIQSPILFFGQFNPDSLQSRVSNKTKRQDHILNIDCLTLTFQLLMVIGHSSVNGEVTFSDKKREDANYIYIDGSQEELHVIQLGLYAHLFQIISTFAEAASEETDTDFEMIEEPDASLIIQLAETIHFEDPNTIQMLRKNSRHLKARVIDGVLGFLRPLALLYKFVSTVPPPESLKDPSFEQLSPLLRYMGLPNTLEGLLNCGGVDSLFTMWGKQLPKGVNISTHYIAQPVKINQLIDLPNEFTELVEKAANFACPSSSRIENNISNIPALCLLCGTIVCAHGVCCQVKMKNGDDLGAANLHMQHCSGQNGAFLRMRDCIINLITPKNRGAFFDGPYVDKYGEQDGGHRRGNRMFFNSELYAKFKKAWLHQEIIETIIHENEVNQRNTVYDWRVF